MGNDIDIELSTCSDHGVVLLAVEAARQLSEGCKTAIVVLTSVCPEDGHGTHVTACVLNKTGDMTPSETRAVVRRLRHLADELEQKFAPSGSEN